VGYYLTRIFLPPLPTIFQRPVGGHFATLDAKIWYKDTTFPSNYKDNGIIFVSLSQNYFKYN
jgi:hypothetical protein